MYKARYYKADGKKGRARALPDALFDGVVNEAVMPDRSDKNHPVLLVEADQRALGNNRRSRSALVFRTSEHSLRGKDTPRGQLVHREVEL
jgi:hypothetical protein